MAIDIRATITCSLGGNLISGSISDDYLQGSGLIKSRGEVEIYGLIAPKLGTAVTFSYTKGGITRTIPRKLRVLSSFADPFRGTTRVQLGCKLTYLSDLKPAPTVDGDAPIETGKRQQCLNGYIEYPANSEFGIPIDAAGLMDTCLSKLGITASSNPLTNKFYKESFDFTPGYVTVLGDLLVSESYCGYLDENEKLQVFSLDDEGGTGPVLDATRLIDVGGIGVGDLPADAVVVRYESITLKEDLSNAEGDTETGVIAKRNWTYDEEVGSLVAVEVATSLGSFYYTYSPYSRTYTTYGSDNSWKDDQCVIAGREGADLSDAVVKRVTYTNMCKAEAANDYCVKCIQGTAFDPAPASTAEAVTIEEFEYDSKGNQIRVTTTKYEPFFAWAGRLNLDIVFPEGPIVFGSGLVEVERTIVESTVLYAKLPSFISLQPGETFERIVNGEKVYTQIYRNIAVTQRGQQLVAAFRENFPFDQRTTAEEKLAQLAAYMILDETSLRTSTNRIVSGVEKRPPKQLRLGGDAALNTENKSELVYAFGNSGGQRIIELLMPYQSDDYYTATGTIVRGDAAAKAARYGRCQNRLLLGNRQGINVQAEPERLPRYPYKPFTVSAAGLSALYRTNGMSWTFSSEGIVASTDALFWGATGQTGGGSIYVPVAPGVTSLPAPPAVTDTSPSSVIGTVATVGTNAQTTLNTAFPSATTGQGVQDTSTDEFWVKGAGGTWTNVGATPGPTSTVTTVVPVANETVVANGIVRCTLTVTSFSYALELLTVVAPLTVRSRLVAARILKVEVPATTITVAAVAPVVSIGAAVRPAATAIAIGAEVPAVAAGASVKPPSIDVALAALAPDVRTGTSVAVPAVDISVAAVAPVSVGVPPVLVDVPTTDVALAAVAPVVVTGTSVAVPAVDISVAAVVPTVLNADPNFSNVSLLLHMDGSNGSNTFTDKSLNALTITATGNAQVSTAQSQFGGASLLLDGSGDYLSLADNAALELGSSSYTIEMWIRTTQSRQYATLITRGNSNFTSGSWSLMINNNSATAGDVAVYLAAYSGVSPLLLTTGVNVRDGAWHHIAWVRSGTSHYLYVDGTQRASRTSTSFTVADMAVTTYIGYDVNFTPRDFDGYIDELRISKVARYTSAFTPPTVAFPDT